MHLAWRWRLRCKGILSTQAKLNACSEIHGTDIKRLRSTQEQFGSNPPYLHFVGINGTLGTSLCTNVLKHRSCFSFVNKWQDWETSDKKTDRWYRVWLERQTVSPSAISKVETGVFTRKQLWSARKINVESKDNITAAICSEWLFAKIVFTCRRRLFKTSVESSFSSQCRRLNRTVKDRARRRQTVDEATMIISKLSVQAFPIFENVKIVSVVLWNLRTKQETSSFPWKSVYRHFVMVQCKKQNKHVEYKLLNHLPVVATSTETQGPI